MQSWASNDWRLSFAAGEVIEHDGEHVQPHGDPAGSFLLAGGAGILWAAQLSAAQPMIGQSWLLLSFAVPIIGGVSQNIKATTAAASGK